MMKRLSIMSLRASVLQRAKQSPIKWRLLRAAALAMTLTLLASCGPVDLNAPIPVFDTGVDPESWAKIPAGEFHFGQFHDMETTDAYEIMVTDVTATQYAAFLNEALADGYVKVDGDQIVGYYHGDVYNGGKHEEKIEAGDWIFVPLNDPSQRVKFDGTTFTVQSGYENHPMTMVSWFGAWGYCEYYKYRLPTEIGMGKSRAWHGRAPLPVG